MSANAVLQLKALKNCHFNHSNVIHLLFFKYAICDHTLSLQETIGPMVQDADIPPPQSVTLDFHPIPLSVSCQPFLVPLRIEGWVSPSSQKFGNCPKSTAFEIVQITLIKYTKMLQLQEAIVSNGNAHVEQSATPTETLNKHNYWHTRCWGVNNTWGHYITAFSTHQSCRV